MSLTREEFVVGTGFDDPAIFEDEDPVKIEKREDPVCNNDGRAVFEGFPHTGKDTVLGGGVDSREAVIEDQDRGLSA